jgi:KRAB domain-containing zinc finger protein
MFSYLVQGIFAEGDDQFFKCDDCKQIFYDKFHYTDHMNIHKGLKPHKCPLCDVHYATSDSLKSHTKSAHGMNLVSARVKALEMEKSAASVAITAAS